MPNVINKRRKERVRCAMWLVAVIAVALAASSPNAQTDSS